MDQSGSKKGKTIHLYAAPKGPYIYHNKYSNFWFCRILKNELTTIAAVSKNDKIYAGKEIIWSRLNAFYLPKASPFEVRIRA